MAHGAVPHFHGHRRCLIARDRRFGGSGAIADRRRRRAETVKAKWRANRPKLKACHAEARKKGLAGDARWFFMSDCIKS
jgi:hypothetical protein